MRRDHQVRLRHMLDAANEAISVARGRSRSDLDSDWMLTLAPVKSIEIIGEAAARVTPDGRAESPEIPWQDIIGMRNRLIHAYFDIDLDRVWDTVSDDLPPRVAVLKRIRLIEAFKG
jgi:uncharacterized protein with HEPN domain